MPLGNWNIQWLNQNSQRSYPFIDGSSGEDQTETVELPDDFIVALKLPVHAGLDVEPEKFYLQQLGIYPTGYTIVLGYDDGTANPPIVASVSVARLGHTENRSYALPGSGDFVDTVGQVTIGILDTMDLLPPGVYVFDPAAATLEVDAVDPIIQGISSLTTVNGPDRSERLYGDIELVAGENIRITASQVGSSAPQITFSAIAGEGLNEDCVCEEESEGDCIKFINGIPPLINGNFRMVGNKCLEINPITNGLQLEDTCSEPCCGCEELEALTRQIDRFADGVLTLQNFSSNLGSEVTQMSQVVLGSRLSDQGCVEC
jgi:hypothetical protein